MPIVNMVNAERSDDLNVEIWIRRTIGTNPSRNIYPLAMGCDVVG